MKKIVLASLLVAGIATPTLAAEFYIVQDTASHCGKSRCGRWFHFLRQVCLCRDETFRECSLLSPPISRLFVGSDCEAHSVQKGTMVSKLLGTDPCRVSLLFPGSESQNAAGPKDTRELVQSGCLIRHEKQYVETQHRIA